VNYACGVETQVLELGIKAPIHNFCKACFQKVSLLDFSNKATILGPEAGTAPTFVFIHGAGGCRNMFEAHARQLSEENGFRCVLIDLPGHGSRMDETLTMDSAIETILRETNSHTSPFKGMKPVAVGGSLGGYLLMEFIGRYPDVFDACVVAMCGQNVGVGRGMAASMGLYLLEHLMKSMSSSSALKLMIDEACKNKHIDKDMLTPILRTGMFFMENEGQISILKATNPVESLSKFEGFILFINGSEDHRDSENVWLRAAKAGRLIDYQGGDHFFTHDRRFMQAFISECAKLASVSS
jgi:pimeloyl-ACP methyl ester carboxylesterase